MQYFYPAMKTISALLLLLCCFSLHAQLQRNYSSYTVDNGLAQNSVWDAFQDYKGYMWFGTADGANRFDGYKMKHYKFRKDDTTSLTGNSAFRFYEDSKNNLWISHNKGLSIYNRTKDCFLNIEEANTVYSNGESYSTVLGEDERGHVWCVSGTQQLKGYNLKDFSLHKSIQVSASRYSVSSIRTCIKSGKFIIGYLNDSSTTWFKLNTETEQTEIIHGPKQFTGFFMLYNDSTICAFGKGFFHLYNINNNTFSAKPITGSIMPGDLVAGTTLTWWQGKIYLGNNTGLYVFNPRTYMFEERIVSFNKSESVGFFYIQYLRVDRSGNLWICTNGSGARCLSPYQNKFKHYVTSESRNTLVKSITTDKNGNIYAGHYGQGLIWYTPNGKSEQYKFNKSKTELTHVLGIAERNNQIFMVNDRLLKVFDPVSKKVLYETNVFSEPSVKDGSYIAYPYFKKDKDRLYVSCDMAIYEVLANGRPKTVVATASTDTFITTFEIMNDSTWWIGTSKQLFEYNLKQNTWKSIPVHIYIKTICFIKASNEVWVGGNTGLFRLTLGGKVQQQYDISDGFPDDFIYGILEDKYHRVWMSHNKGISVYLPQTKTFKHYGVKDGLQSNEFNTGAFYKDEAGLLYFGGVNGLNVINPDNLIENKNPPQISINEIMLGDMPYKSDTAHCELQCMNLNYLENTLSFDFSALEFSQPEDNIYQYKLEGYDNKWIESGTRHFARYANLPPGNYTLKIKAANGDGHWNPAPKMLFINITPPFWQRSWFYVLMVLLGVVVFAGIGLLIINRQKVKLKRDLELQQKLEQERLRISRDLHDNVGAQLSYLITNIEWMLEHPDQLSEVEEQQRLKALSETGRNAILTLRQTIWAISNTTLSVEDFADRFKQFALKMLEFNAEVHVHFKDHFIGNKNLSPAVALNMFRICQEAFNNCLKHAQCSEVNIRFESNETYLFAFTIEDNGIGFDWDEAQRKGHYGLVNMQARASETHATLSIHAEKGKGTALALHLK